MRRSFRDEFGITLTLPLGIERRERRRQRLRRTVMIALLVLGAALLAMGLYLPAKAALAQQLLNRAWNESRDDHRTVRPWPWADTWPVARLTLPHESAPLTVLAGASGRNLAFAPTLLDGSAEPGTPGVTVIAGHRDTHFRALEDMAIGDEFTIERPDGVTFRYAVAALDVIDADRDVLRLDADENVVALVTCWPFDAVTPGGPERYVVTGVPVGTPGRSASAMRRTL